MLGESLRITVEYLRNEEKVVVANSKVNVLEVEASKLRKDPIIVMDGTTTVEASKVMSDELIVEKALMKQKDDQNQVFLLKVDEEK